MTLEQRETGRGQEASDWSTRRALKTEAGRILSKERQPQESSGRPWRRKRRRVMKSHSEIEIDRREMKANDQL
jgi:hypothetical protein